MTKPEITDIDPDIYDRIGNHLKEGYYDDYDMNDYNISYNPQEKITIEGLDYAGSVFYFEIEVIKDEDKYTYLAEVDNDSNTLSFIIDNDEVIKNIMEHDYIINKMEDN